MKSAVIVAIAAAVGLAGCSGTVPKTGGNAAGTGTISSKEYDKMSDYEKEKEARRIQGYDIFTTGKCTPSRTRRCF